MFRASSPPPWSPAHRAAAGATHLAHRRAHTQARGAFVLGTSEITLKIEERLAYRQVLRGRGPCGVPEVTRDEWRHVEALRLHRGLRGHPGRRLRPVHFATELAEHERHVRAEGFS
jgi:hypothetical protein